MPRPGGATANLMGALLGRDIENTARRTGHVGRHGQQKCRLANARFASYEHAGTRHDAATQYTVELANTERQARQIVARYCVQGDSLSRGHSTAGARTRLVRCAYDRFFKRIPVAAVGTLATPLELNAATGGADVLLLVFSHGVID